MRGRCFALTEVAFPLCKALIDRIADRANTIETGTESYLFRRTLEKRKTKICGHQDLVRVPGRIVKFYTLKATEELLTVQNYTNRRS